jgi:thymidylate synthase
MEPVFIESTTISDSWFQCLREILVHGYTYTIDRGSYAGQQRLEFDYVVVRIKYPDSRPLLPECPPGCGIPNPASNEYLEEYLPYLFTSHKNPNEDYVYGSFLEKQIEKVIEIFSSGDHGTNQACMTVGDQYSLDLEDPPCLKILDCRVKDGKLNFIIYFRSNDLWNGYPINMASLQILKEYIAESSGLEDGEIIYSSKGLHIYNHVWDLAKQVVGGNYTF